MVLSKKLVLVRFFVFFFFFCPSFQTSFRTFFDKSQTLDVSSFQTGQHKSLAFAEVRRKERQKTDDLLKSNSCYFLF